MHKLLRSIQNTIHLHLFDSRDHNNHDTLAKQILKLTQDECDNTVEKFEAWKHKNGWLIRDNGGDYIRKIDNKTINPYDLYKEFKKKQEKIQH